eukprot:11647600-Alexandrium_andersonii.AAC.1
MEDENQLVEFGKHRGLRYGELPTNYLEWSIREMGKEKDAGDGLRRLARRARKQLRPAPEDMPAGTTAGN